MTSPTPHQRLMLELRTALRRARDIEEAVDRALQAAESLMSTKEIAALDIDHCPGCGLPGHATETDDDGYHPGCRKEEPSK